MKRLLMVAALMVLALPAQAHTESQLETWLETQDQIVDSLTVTLAPRDLVAVDPRGWSAQVLEEMRSRHPCSRVFETWEDDRCSRPAAVTHAPAPSGNTGMGSNVEQWRGLVAAYFPASEVERALCIMSHESGGNPNAQNPRSTAAGLFQFLRSTWDSLVPRSVTGGSYGSGRVFVPEANVAAAAWLVAADGWYHWAPWNRGLCR